jgi:hypothetical protein
MPVTEDVSGLHLQYGADASTEVVVSWHTRSGVRNPRVMFGTPDDGLGQTAHGFVAFDVDPGQPGGTTSIAATYYAVNGPFGKATPVDRFTLTRPRRDGLALTVT